MATYDVGLKIGIEGDASFNNQLKLINQQTKELNAEMKNVTSAFDKTDRSEAKLSATAAVLTKQMENQGAKVELLKQKLSEQEKELEKIGAEYQKVVAEEGENSAAAQNPPEHQSGSAGDGCLQRIDRPAEQHQSHADHQQRPSAQK